MGNRGGFLGSEDVPPDYERKSFVGIIKHYRAGRSQKARIWPIVLTLLISGRVYSDRLQHVKCHTIDEYG